MKNIIFFITHKTLTTEHADCTFYSMSQQNIDIKFDVLYLYNTHSDELSNEYLLELYNKYELHRFFNEVKVFDYKEKTKTLCDDIRNIREYVCSKYNLEDRVLLLKSDCLLSKNYFSDIMSLPKDRNVYFVAPFICAKERVTNDEIYDYINRDKFISSDDITFFVEDTNHTRNNDFNNRPNVSILDEQIKFTSCYVIQDFSCHFLTVGLFPYVMIGNQTWGGTNFSNLIGHFIPTDRSFVVHKYHDIISENRSTGREGPVESWLLS